MPTPDPDRERADATILLMLHQCAGRAEIVIHPEGSRKPHRVQYPAPCMYSSLPVPITDRPPRAREESDRGEEVAAAAASECEQPDALAGLGDYRRCFWESAGGGPFFLNKKQGAVVEILARAYADGNPEVRQEVLLRAARKCGSDAKCLRDVFAENNAWGSLVVRGRIGGTYRLPPLEGDQDWKGGR